MLSKVGILCALRMSHPPGTFNSGQKCMAYSILMPRAMRLVCGLCALIAFVLFVFVLYFVRMQNSILGKKPVRALS